MSFSCTEKDDEPVVPKTSGELYPAYVGMWYNNSTKVDGVVSSTAMQYEFEIQNVKAYLTYNNNGDRAEFSNWDIISGTTLKLTGNPDFLPENSTFTIISTPTLRNKIMVLEMSQNNKKYTYYLSEI